jgi:hypothetical protein
LEIHVYYDNSAARTTVSSITIVASPVYQQWKKRKKTDARLKRFDLFKSGCLKSGKTID